MEDREILRPAEVGALLGLSTGRVYQLIAEGAIPATRIGRALRIPRRAWEGWLEEQRRRAVADAREAKLRGEPEPRDGTRQ